MKYPAELVLRVNELYHDIEGRAYDDRHPEILRDEQARWQHIGRTFVAAATAPTRLLDVGTGTGFVPLQIGPFLGAGDSVVCSDISANMLRVCEANLSDKLDVPVEYLKLDGTRIELASESVDVVTLNSVLHHIPDHSSFFDEIDRLMRAGGRLVICHEPNRRFYSHRLLWSLSRLTDRLLHPRKLVGAVLRKLGLDRFARRVPRDSDREAEHYREIAVEVNARLVEEGLIDSPLTYLEMTEIVDIHSPTAGAGGREGVGIDVAEITNRHLPNFDLVHLETYGHLQLGSHNRFTRWSDAALGRAFPELGSTLTVVLEKRQATADN